MIGLRNSLHHFSACVCLASLVMGPGSAWASGFAIREQSGSSQGHSFASASTGIEDISTMFFNPSLLTFHEGNQLVTVGNVIFPVLILFYVVHGAMGRWIARHGGASAAGLGLGLILAWALGVSIPLYDPTL